MTTVHAVLLRCDGCGEIFDNGSSSVRHAVTTARGTGWERTRRKRVTDQRGTWEIIDRCGICTGKYVRAGEFLVPASEVEAALS